MRTPIYFVGLVLAVALAGCRGCGGGESVGPVKEITQESITKEGDTWHVSFQSKIDAPVDKVWEVFTQPERMHDIVPENILKSELVEGQAGDKTKTVDWVIRLDILPPGFKVQNVRNNFTLYPEEHRFTQKSVDFKLADIQSEYKFAPTPDGKGTIVTFTQTSKDKAPLIVDSLQKGALRETYILTVKGANKALGLEKPETKAPAAG